MPTDSQPPTEHEWQRISQLLPPSEAQASSIWSPEEIQGARKEGILAHLKAGWKFVEGFLEHALTKKRPTAVMRSKSGQPDFNPRTDAFAVKLGAEWRSDNRYYHPGSGQWMDRNGLLLPAGECPECGGTPWHVKVQVSGPSEWPRRYALGPCMRCTTPAERQDAKERRERHAQQQQAGPQRRSR